MDTTSIITFLRSVTDLSEKFIRALEESLRHEFYKPHQIIHAAGQTESRLSFIETGFARNYFYDQNGQEHTVKFWEPGNIIFSCEGYYKVSSYYYTEIMEESKLITLTYGELHDLNTKYPEISALIKALLLKFQYQEFQRQILISLPNEDRYRLLRKDNKTLFQKAPSRMIASYLNMSRETLARLIAKH